MWDLVSLRSYLYISWRRVHGSCDTGKRSIGGKALPQNKSESVGFNKETRYGKSTSRPWWYILHNNGPCGRCITRAILKGHKRLPYDNAATHPLPNGRTRTRLGPLAGIIYPMVVQSGSMHPSSVPVDTSSGPCPTTRNVFRECQSVNPSPPPIIAKR